MKFKVGDKVKLVSALNETTEYEKYVGKIGEIIETKSRKRLGVSKVC